MKQLLLLFIVILSLAHGQDESPATVRIHHERSTDSNLKASVEAFGKTHHLSLKDMKMHSVQLSELRLVNGSISVVQLPDNGTETRFFSDEETGATFFMNEENKLEGMLTDEIVIKYADNKHVASKIRKPSSSAEKTCGTSDHAVTNTESETKSENESSLENSPNEKDAKATVRYYVEVLVVVDSTLARHLGSDYNIVKYMSCYWWMVYKRFRTASGVYIYLRLKSILVSRSTYADNLIMVPYGSIYANMIPTIHRFSYFIYSYRSRLPSHDTAQLMTKKDLAYITGSTIRREYIGMAFSVGGICYYRNYRAYHVSVVEDDGYYKAMLTSAHQIGHILGSYDDGQGTSRSCPARWGYLMSPYRLNYRTFFFSSCSSAAMRNIYYRSHATCLRSTSGSNYMTRCAPGLYMTLDAQCRMRTGRSNAYADPYWPASYQCYRLRCRYRVGSRTYIYWSYYPALEGSRCRTGGYCNHGTCRSYWT